jgi:hypothetical protein
MHWDVSQTPRLLAWEVTRARISLARCLRSRGVLGCRAKPEAHGQEVKPPVAV